MAATTVDALLKQPALPPVVLLASAEPLLLQEAGDAVRAAARAQGFSERDVFDVDARFDWGQIEASAGALSLFATRRIIELRLPTGKPGKDGGEVIERLCAEAAPDVLVLIVCTEWSKKHEAAWTRAVERAGALVVLWPPRPTELEGWMQRRARAAGLRLDAEAVQTLVERTEGNLLAAAQDIDKLALLVGDAPVGRERLLELVADSARYDVFGLCDAALAGDAARALRMLLGLRAEGEAVPALMGAIIGQLQQLAQVSMLVDRGVPAARAMDDARVWKTRQAMLQRALSRGSAAHWERLLADAGQVDRMAKGRAAGDPWIALERLLVRIARPRALAA